MFSMLIGLSMFVAVAQELPVDPESAPPEATQEQQQAPEEQPGEGDEASADAVARNGQDASADSADVEDEEEAQVCRRVTTYDMLGRQHSRRVCRPR